MSKKTYAEMMAVYSQEKREEHLRKAREREARRRAEGKVAKWRQKPETRELIRKNKEIYRRKNGAIERSEIANRAARRMDGLRIMAAEKKKAKELFDAAYVGPPAPRKTMTDAEYYRWRTRTDPDFYAKELDRAQNRKARTRPGYRDSIVKWAEMPAAVKQAKHAMYLIARELERVEHENNQRAA